MKNQNNKFFSWSTKKVNGKFQAKISLVEACDTIQDETGNYTKVQVLKVETFSTRARAKSYAQRMIRHYKANGIK